MPTAICAVRVRLRLFLDRHWAVPWLLLLLRQPGIHDSQRLDAGDPSAARSACGAAGCAGGDCACSDQAIARRGGRAGKAGHAAAEGGPLMAGPGHFHPVPTRPVFGLRPELMAVPVSAPLDDAPQSLPELESVPVPEDSMPDEPDNSARPAPMPQDVQVSTYTNRCNSCR